MNNPITLTPADMVRIILAVCGAIITVSAAVTIIINLVKKAKEPENEQNARIARIEGRMDEIDEKLDRDNRRLNRIEYGHEVTQEVLLAILNHFITGNDLEGLKSAKSKLERYLIERREA